MDDDWVLCWRVDLNFHEQKSNTGTCLVCSKEVAKGSYVSTFAHDALQCRRHGLSFPELLYAKRAPVECVSTTHYDLGRVGCICSFCNKDVLLNSTLRKQKCFRSGCECFVNIDEKIVRTKVEDAKLLEEYAILL
jgi:hypothetical protein